MSTIKEFASQLADVYMRIEDCKAEAVAILDAAKADGFDAMAMRKVAKELIMPSDKLSKRFDAEAQIDMFRDNVGLRTRKGLRILEAAE